MRMLTHMLPCMGPGAPPCPPRARHTRYVGERTTEQRTYERLKDDPNIETYVMGIKSLNIDALVVRNHAPFAAFACSVDNEVRGGDSHCQQGRETIDAGVVVCYHQEETLFGNRYRER